MCHEGGAELAVFCSPDGTITEVLQNRFELKHSLAAGLPLAGIAVAGSRGKMLSFFQQIWECGPALDCELEVVFKRGILPLFFSGHRTGFGILIIGSSKSRLPKELRGRLVEMSSEIRNHARNGGAKSDTARCGATIPEPPAAGDQLTRLNAELLDAQRELAEKKLALEKQKIETFKELGMAVHGLRNPASSILSATEYLIEETANLAQEQVTLLRGVMESSLFILQIVDDVLEISAIECGKLKMELRPTDLISVVNQVLLLNQEKAERKGVRLHINSEIPVFVVDIDPIKIAQVIDNLVSNAIKFSKPGARVKIRVSATESTASVSVCDEGPGISADHIKTVFDLFQSDRNEGGLHRTGTGLGLAISKRLVEAHAGTIEVKSQIGKGSIFTVNFPRTAAGHVQPAEPPRKKPGQYAVAADRLARHAGSGA